MRDHASSRSILSSPALNAALLCVFLGAVDLTVIAAILPRMITDIGVNTSDIDRYIWIVSGYLIAYIVAIPIVGRISDLAGRKYTFLVSLGIFLIGSIVCGLAQSLDGLIVGRSIQGFGGGGLLPVALALTGDTLPRGRRLAGIGVVSAVDTLGWVIGPVYGAVVEFLASGTSEGWRWVFWINVPLLLIAAGFVLLKFPAESPGRSLAALRRLDVPGAILLAIMLVAVNLALSAGGEIGSATGSGLRALGGTANPLARYVPALLVLTLIALAGLIVWERRSSHPILPVSLLANRTFALISLANFLVGAVLMVGMVDVPVVVALVSDPKRTSDISAGML
ncbi:MAG TPA: MFS transporter, partial [Thermomicrobiales bacterium]|nr:MFS transporter [Thermomicrobiales bacterium]